LLSLNVFIFGFRKNCVVIIAPQVNWNFTVCSKKYDRQDQQEKAAFNEHNPYITQQQEPAARESRRTPNKNRTGREAEHRQDNHSNGT
jgi:hypothetical protein